MSKKRHKATPVVGKRATQEQQKTGQHTRHTHTIIHMSKKFPRGTGPWVLQRPFDKSHPVCPNSFASADAIVSNYFLNWNVDMSERIISGWVAMDIDVKKATSVVVVDSKDLNLEKVEIVCSPDAEIRDLKYTVGEAGIYGQALTIHLGKEYKAGDHISIKVTYSTSKKATAIGFLDAPQTLGKKHPFLFTQCEAIHARSLLPCQDTPAIKSTYSARVTCPAPLSALMSAVESHSVENAGTTRTFSWEQKVPIPTYLIALAVGNLESRDVSPRCRIWAEPEMVEKAAWEFEETDTFISTAEQVTRVPYLWGRYDMLVLCPAFPYGGMENPALVFLTPTLISGDRSQVDVVAHEGAHSWTGNLVTNSSWDAFFLNEGFTTFLERKIMAKMYGEEVRQLSYLLGYKHLKEAVEQIGEDHPFTALVRDLSGKDPDDAFSTVPYEKGANFLYYLEQILGADNFGLWLTKYLEDFSYKSITCDDFVQHVFGYFGDEKNPGGGAEAISKLESVDWVSWLMHPGMPPVANKFDDTLAREADTLAQQWSENVSSSKDVWDKMTPTQRMRFLDSLALYPLSLDTIKALDSTYDLSKNRNSEIRCRWQDLCLACGYETIFPQVVDFVTSQGRMKYVRPLYRFVFGNCI